MKRTSIPCTLDTKLETITIGKEASIAVFRIIQESLTNVIRHAEATKVVVRIGKKKKQYEIEIIDDGVGITSERKTGSFSLGVLGMRERAEGIGGQLHITGAAGKGTSVKVIVAESGE